MWSLRIERIRGNSTGSGAPGVEVGLSGTAVAVAGGGFAMVTWVAGASVGTAGRPSPIRVVAPLSQWRLPCGLARRATNRARGR